jgi:outer membrane receptor protein involved in Fe transport
MNKKSLRNASSASNVARLGALALTLASAVPNVSRAASENVASAARANVSGAVSSTDGSSIAGVRFVFMGLGPDAVATSDRTGHFRAALRPGTYAVTVTANGYTPLQRQTVTIASSGSVLDFTLARAQASSLTVIGSVRANGRRALDTAPGPTLDINAQTQAARGVTRVSDILANQLSTTVVPAIGGGMNAPAVVAVRGPDPSETLVDIDGHQANNGSTGDFDLSLLDPADLQSVQVIYGIAPSSLFGPNTLGGALNVRTLEPTAQPHVLERLSGGTNGTFSGTLSTTGTDDRLGYAFSVHRLASSGDVHDAPFPATNTASAASAGFADVGDSLDATSTIAKLRYSLFNGAGFVGVSYRGQSVYRDLSAALSSIEPTSVPGAATTYTNYAGSSILSDNAAYGLDAQIPLGRRSASGLADTSVTLRHQTSLVHQSVDGPGTGTTPYLYDDRDLIGDDTVEIQHLLPRGTLSAKFALTDEDLTTNVIAGNASVTTADAIRAATQQRLLPQDDDEGPPLTTAPDLGVVYLGQTQRSLGLRYAAEPTSKLHYSFATYFSDYSTFGHSIDPRFGFVWTPTADSAVRVSVGSSFESPTLPSFIVPPTLPAAADGYIHIGNPNLTAERATAYDAGYEHTFRIPGHALNASLDLYRTNLHNGEALYTPSTPCLPGVDYGNTPPCISYPINVAREVYQGVELRSDLRLAPNTRLGASYDVDSVYIAGAPGGGALNIVPFQQQQGVPLHKYSFDVEHDQNAGFSYYAGLLYEGAYNETNLGPYASLRAGATWHLRGGTDLGINGTNLTNAYAFKYTRVGGGIPYGGLSGTGFGAVPTNAIPIAPSQITISLSHRS